MLVVVVLYSISKKKFDPIFFFYLLVFTLRLKVS